ncbi:MAG: ph-response sensor protein, partial [Watsoniomyces obsoletus]
MAENLVRRVPPCTRCLKNLHAAPDDLVCVSATAEAEKCARCVRMGRPCYTTTKGPLAPQARQVQALWEAFFALPVGPAREEARGDLQAAARAFKNAEETASRVATKARKRELAAAAETAAREAAARAE